MSCALAIDAMITQDPEGERMWGGYRQMMPNRPLALSNSSPMSRDSYVGILYRYDARGRGFQVEDQEVKGKRRSFESCSIVLKLGTGLV
jgi:hypothetical protein